MKNWLFPTLTQWKKWSLPSKLTAIGTLCGVISLIFAGYIYLSDSSAGKVVENAINKQMQGFRNQGKVNPKLTNWYTGTWIINAKKTMNELSPSLLSNLDELKKGKISETIDFCFNNKGSKQEEFVQKFANREYIEQFIQKTGLQLTFTPTHVFGSSKLNEFKRKNEEDKEGKLCKSFFVFENPLNAIKIIPLSNSIAHTEPVNRNLFYYDSRNILKKELIEETVSIHKTENGIYILSKLFLHISMQCSDPVYSTEKSEFIPLKIYLEKISI